MVTYYSLSAFFNFSVSLLLGLFVLHKNPNSKLNKSLFFWCASVSFWSFFYFLWQIEKTESIALLWTRVLMLGAVWVPVAYFRVVLIFLDIEKKYKKFLYFNYALSIIFSILLLTPLMVSRVEPLAGFRFWPQPGLAYAPFLLMFIGLSAYSAYLSYQALKTEPSAIKRAQIKYMLLGIAISIVGGSTNYLLWYHIPIKPYGNLFASTYVLFSVYAILRYRLMDMRVIARVFTIYFFDILLVYIIYALFVCLYPFFSSSSYSNYALLVGLVVAPAIVAGLFNFHSWIVRFIDKYFFYSLYDYQKTISELTRELNMYNDLDKILNLIVSTIKKTMNLNRAGVLLSKGGDSLTKYKIAKVTGFDINNGISLVRDSFFTKYLKQTAKPLVREELSLLARDAKSTKERKALLDLEREMKHIEASLCLPLLKSGQLRGIIVLGSKNSGDPFTNEDLSLLSTLALQAGVAIENARLYQEVRGFNKVLQSKVDDQTKELKARALHLEKLLKMREEFLDIASHQLKTPVSVIRGTISMFREGSMDKLSKVERQKFFDNIYHKTEKLNAIISDILRASEIESEEFKIDPASSKKVQLEDILKEVHGDLKETAVEKKLSFELVLPKKKAAPILTSVDFLEQAIFNLVDNAIKYTKEGFVKMEMTEDGDVLTVKISDSGIGIPETDQKKMFDKFSRAKNAVNMYTDGTGLGLFIAKEIVEAHAGGSLAFASKENEGTSFTLKLKTAKR
jgi:signal transduction histidine kinase